MQNYYGWASVAGISAWGANGSLLLHIRGSTYWYAIDTNVDGAAILAVAAQPHSSGATSWAVVHIVTWKVRRIEYYG